MLQGHLFCSGSRRAAAARHSATVFATMVFGSADAPTQVSAINKHTIVFLLFFTIYCVFFTVETAFYKRRKWLVRATKNQRPTTATSHNTQETRHKAGQQSNKDYIPLKTRLIRSI